MLDIGWSEFLVIGVAALIFVGPKDLPVMFRTLGRFTARARAMAREFQKAMDDAAKSTGVHETMQDVRDMTSKKSLGLTALENAAEKFEKWNPMKPEPRPSSPTPRRCSRRAHRPRQSSGASATNWLRQAIDPRAGDVHIQTLIDSQCGGPGASCSLTFAAGTYYLFPPGGPSQRP
mgnify:CR=1 FL=1